MCVLVYICTLVYVVALAVYVAVSTSVYVAFAVYVAVSACVHVTLDVYVAVSVAVSTSVSASMSVLVCQRHQEIASDRMRKREGRQKDGPVVGQPCNNRALLRKSARMMSLSLKSSMSQEERQKDGSVPIEIGLLLIDPCANSTVLLQSPARIEIFSIKSARMMSLLLKRPGI